MLDLEVKLPERSIKAEKWNIELGLSFIKNSFKILAYKILLNIFLTYVLMHKHL